jgi:hypothetical protein
MTTFRSLLLAAAALLLVLPASAQRNKPQPPKFRVAYGINQGRVLQSDDLSFDYDSQGRIEALNIGTCEAPLRGFGACGQDFVAENLDVLTSSAEFVYHVLDEEMEGELAFLGFGNMTIERGEQVVIIQFFQRKVVNCESGGEAQLGIGVQLALKVNKKFLKGGLDLARLAQLGEGKNSLIQYSVKTFGITGPAVTAVIPTATHFNNAANNDFNRLLDVVRNFGNIRTNLVICPTPLPFFVEQQGGNAGRNPSSAARDANRTR